MKNTILKGITGPLVTLILFLSTSATAYLFYQLENLAFNAGNYVWSGVGDVFFWFLAFLESYIGFLVFIFALPKKLGFENYRYIYNYDFPRTIDRYINATLLGVPLGLAFSGIWKLIFLMLFIIRPLG